MKREDLLTDDEALDRALAALEGSPVPAKKASKMARTALAAAGLLSVSTAVHAWAIGTLVVGSLVATSGTAYLVLQSGGQGGAVHKAREIEEIPPAPLTNHKAGELEEIPPKGGQGGEQEIPPAPLKKGGQEGEQEDPEIPPKGGQDATPPTPLIKGGQGGSLLPKPPLIKGGQGGSLPVAQEIPPKGGQDATPPTPLIKGGQGGSLLPKPPLIKGGQGGSLPHKESQGGSLPVAMESPAPPPPPEPPPLETPAPEAVAAVPAPEVVAASPPPESLPPGNAPKSGGFQRTLGLELGAHRSIESLDPALLTQLPALRLSLQGIHTRPSGFLLWRNLGLEAGALRDLLSSDRRLQYGLEGGLGIGWQGGGPFGKHWGLEPGWMLGLRWLPPSSPDASPTDLSTAGWGYAVTGPQLGLRLGDPAGWSFTLKAQANGTWLNIDPDPLATPQLHTGFGVWMGFSRGQHSVGR